MRRPSSQRVFSGWETLALWLTGFLLVIGAVALVQHASLNDAQRRLGARLDAIYQELSQHLGSGDVVLNSLSSLYQASDELSSTELTSISQELLKEYPYVSSVAFLTLVRDEEREAFEHAMRREGYMHFRIRSGPFADGGKNANSTGSRHLPVSFLEPLTPDTARFLGWDLLADPSLKGALNRAVNTGHRAVASSTLLSRGRPGYLLTRATYFGHFRPEGVDARRDQLSGAFVLNLDVGRILMSVQSRYPDTDITLRSAGLNENGHPNLEFNASRSSPYSYATRFSPRLSAIRTLNVHDINFRLEVSSRSSWRDLDLVHSSLVMVLAVILSISYVVLLRNRRLARIKERASKDRIFREKERAEVTLESIRDGVITTDNENRIRYMNPVAEQLTGWRSTVVRGQRLEDVVQLLDEKSKKPVEDIMQCGTTPFEKGENLLLVRRDGRTISAHHTVSTLHDRDGTASGAVFVIRDVSRERELAQELSYQASHDSLTGLFNRRMFEHRLMRLLDTVGEDDAEHALCYMDLDQFKVINDTCGHLAGDELLRQLGRMLMKQVRKRDTIARLGGDEFGVLMEYCNLEEAMIVADTLRTSVEEFRFVSEGKSFNLGVSIGLVPISSASAGIVDVLSAADAACYTAKDKGRNRIHVFRHDDAELERRHTEMHWVVEIQRAIEESRLALYYQPIMPVGNEADRAHYELLLRMKDENGKLIPPGGFLPAVERYDLSDRLDRWVVESAFKWLVDHPGEKRSPNICSINLSGQSLGDSAFLEFVTRKLKYFGISPRKICFEVTETAAVANFTSATTFISTLSEQGCYFALDDFGTGLSSFGYLKSLPVDFLKIDGMFIKDIADDPLDRAMVRSVNEMGHVMGKMTIAEFVENDNILRVLEEIGVDYAQGYRIGRPQPLEEFSKKVSYRNAAPLARPAENIVGGQ